MAWIRFCRTMTRKRESESGEERVRKDAAMICPGWTRKETGWGWRRCTPPMKRAGNWQLHLESSRVKQLPAADDQGLERKSESLNIQVFPDSASLRPSCVSNWCDGFVPTLTTQPFPETSHHNPKNRAACEVSCIAAPTRQNKLSCLQLLTASQRSHETPHHYIFLYTPHTHNLLDLDMSIQ